MASQALQRFRDEVEEIPDGIALTPARKQLLLEVGERLFVAGARETILHLRKHAVAVRDDVDETNARRQRAQALVVLIDEVRAKADDAWWLDIVDG